MFLKRCERRKRGRKYTYWVLVESYRTARGSRHRVIAYLGTLGRGEKSGWAQLGRSLSGKRRSRPDPSLFDPPHYDEPDEDEPVLVNFATSAWNASATSATSGWPGGCGDCSNWMFCLIESCPEDGRRFPGP